MEWRNEAGYVVTDDVSRIDREFVWHWLAHESYWAQGRTREVMERAIDGVRQQTLRTQDAHGLYAKFGYRAITPDELPTWMVRYPFE